MRSRAAAATFVVIASLVAGPAGALAQSLNVTLKAHVDNYSEYSDVWGYTSPLGVEIAIIGTTFGTSFVDVTDTDNPTEVLFVPGSSSIWRDIKTYGHYAYIVEDSVGDGIQIVDLSDPHHPFLTNTQSTYVQTSHNDFVDVGAGVLYCVGPTTHVFDLTANPANPTHIGSFSDYYVHDMYARNGLAFMSAIYVGLVTSVDVSSLPTMTTLGDAITDGAFCHNVWLTDSGRYALTTDEVSGGHITVFDVSDPANLVRVGSFVSPDDPTSIIHNVTIRGDYAYISWYKDGLQILYLGDPAHPQRVGYYDTFPGSGTGYDGAWGVYPFAQSGLIYISDISTGLYVFQFTPDFGTVSGVVRDSQTDEPIAGVSVSIPSAGLEATTDPDGHYGLAADPGDYDVEFEGFGYDPGSIPVTITLGQDTNGDASLDPQPAGELDGFVVAQGSLVGIGGAEVELLGTPLTATTAADGSYDFPSVPAGGYPIRASTFGLGATTGYVSIAGGGTTSKSITLTPSFFVDDIESDLGWSVGDVDDDATTGIWVRVDPVGTYPGMGPYIQPEDDHTVDPGVLCYITGQATDPTGIGQNDVDNGKTTLFSPVLDLSGLSAPVLRYHRWYVNNGSSAVDDVFNVDITSNGVDWVPLEVLPETRRFWEKMEFPLAGKIPLTSTVQVRFIASDYGSGSIVEAGIDDFEIFEEQSVPTSTPDGPLQEYSTRLLSAAPSPFRPDGPAAGLRFELDHPGRVILDVLDVEGRKVRRVADGPFEAGSHLVAWDGRNDRGQALPAGVYFQVLRAGGATRSGKLVMVR